jgi:hypothetical protein
MAGLVRRISIRKVQPMEHPCVKPIRHRSELRADPSRADAVRHVAWRALGSGGQGSSTVGLSGHLYRSFMVLMRCSSPAQRLVGDDW